MESTVLTLSGITKRFGALVANDDVSLDLAKGEVLALLGENGAGKSTLVSILFGHYVADEGTITAFGTALPPGDPAAALATGIGMVHQHFTLADNLTVLDNILIGTEPLWQPFSPKSASTSPRASSSDTWSFATSAPKRLVMPDRVRTVDSKEPLEKAGSDSTFFGSAQTSGWSAKSRV